MALIPLDATAADRIGAALYNYADALRPRRASSDSDPAAQSRALGEQFAALGEELAREPGTTFAVVVLVEVRA